jgi:outer membrane murein-binding lipoprotein Lpp
MLLRISLIFAILAGIGALAVSQLKVHTKITELTNERDQLATDLNQARVEADTAKNNERRAKEAQEKAERDLAETRANLDAMTARANEQQRRADGLQAELNETILERNRAQQQLSQWTVFGLSPQQIEQRLAQIAELRKEKDGLAAENTTLARELRVVKNRLALYEGDNQKVELPVGLKGKVTAVDPEWNFVVLDIGQTQGVLERGEMMVHRDGKLVAKVRIVRVEPDRSIANVLPGWKQADVLEGDQVLY